MNGLDINVRNTYDFVQETDVIHVSFTASFVHPNAQHIIYNTNFVERLSPQMKHTIDNFYDEYCMHVVLNRPTVLTTSTPPPTATPTATTTTSRELNESLGSSRRVVHEHHYQGQTCAVCHSNYKQNEFVRTLPMCKHFFHKRCIDPWIKRNHTPTCPVCRTQIIQAQQTDSSHPDPAQTSPAPEEPSLHHADA